jgi:hypothetical protein
VQAEKKLSPGLRRVFFPRTLLCAVITAWVRKLKRGLFF